MKYSNFNKKIPYHVKQTEKMLEYELLAGVKRPAVLLLDSSLISATNLKKYKIKIIRCGSYYQVYYYNNIKIKNNKEYEKIDIDYLFKNKETLKNKNDLKIIEYKNIMRSKFSLQRLAKANENTFKTFITLTFHENKKEIGECNKIFHNFCRQVQRRKKDFAYICVPEFQKRGAVHYHLMTNLDIKQNPDIIIPQKNKKSCYDVKYWNNGFSSVYPINSNEVIGYLTKYFTKDIDNRLWGKRRYLYSMNLDRPEEIYIDTTIDQDFILLADLMSHSEVVYNNTYLDVFGDTIDFIEYKM